MGQINSYSAKTTPAGTDEYILQETGGGTTKKITHENFLSVIQAEVDALQGASILTKTGDYTILDSDLSGVSHLYIIANGSVDTVTLTLPTLADNQGKLITVKVIDDTNLCKVDGESTETIDTLQEIELPKVGNTITVLGTSIEWKILNESITAQLFLNTYAGHGSTDTKIMRFTNSVENIGNLFTENHSTGYNSNTEGLEITIQKAGKYYLHFTSGGQVENGISLNSSQLTTNLQSITVGDRLNFGAYNDNDANTQSVVLFLDVNDVLRAHTKGNAPVNSAFCNFIVSYIGS